jgi:putative glutathione S-transferase
VDFDHIKRHYYTTHPQLNPTRIVPKGPELDLWSAHGRDEVVWPPGARNGWCDGRRVK